MLFGGFFMTLLLQGILTFSMLIFRAQKGSDIGLLQQRIVTLLYLISKLSALTFSKPISRGSDRTWRTPALWFRLLRVAAEWGEPWLCIASRKPNVSVFAPCNSTSSSQPTKTHCASGRISDLTSWAHFPTGFATPDVDLSTFT